MGGGAGIAIVGANGAQHFKVGNRDGVKNLTLQKVILSSHSAPVIGASYERVDGDGNTAAKVTCEGVFANERR